ncbi:autotransporter outer membrane beta-barrel domain-containing protein [Brevundimonas lutea]|uniref:autotransporter outer membrane beta-barrel domain-containing protein n=1 Tax=Brevundimonas lutea TaxID=2293980 RepID=UPI000F012986|nr:autotransporter outer membrane beta-barrel domain-containing protein [Brevundimonas lutea]
MRKLLVTAVALAPLAIASGAMAQTQIDDDRTTPVLTSNPDGDGPEDVILESGGTITLDEGVAVTLDSDNDVTVESGGSIVMTDSADGSTGILGLGGNSGSITIGGSIRVTDGVDEYEDEDEDGDLDGPFAEGADRYGVRITGDQPLIGDLTVERSGTITAEGANAYGVWIENILDGDFRTFGSVNTIGTDSAAIRISGGVTGDAVLSGAISGLGEGAMGASIVGDIDGALIVQAGITANGFRYTSRPQLEEVLEGLDPDDLLLSGPALQIAGNVGGGVLLDIPPPAPEDDGDDDEDEDEDEDEDDADADTDGNGIPDAQERASTITSLGSGPAVEIGSSDRDIVLGAVGEGDEAFGFINRGDIAANGVYDGFEATAVRIGVDGGFGVDIAGGVRNEGTIASTAFEESATAIAIGDGATFDQLVNAGEMQTNAISDSADHGAYGVLIGQGASVASLSNAQGVIGVRLGGESGEAVAIRDLSGTLTDISNTGVINAVVARTITGDQTGDEPITARAIAIDVSANTSGVTITQNGVPFEDDGDEDTPQPPDADDDGVADTDEPLISGDVLLGSGSDLVDIRNGVVRGDISFGDGQDSLLVSGGARITGALSDSDGLLDIDISNGVLDARQTETIDVTGLNVGADGDLVLTVDPENDTRGGFRVNGTATFADGAGLGLQFASLLDDAERFVVVDADNLVVGDLDAGSLAENSPYLFVTEAGIDQAAGQIYIDARRRTGDEIGFIDAENAAYDGVYDALRTDEELRDVFLAQIEREGFIELYEQMLPDHSGGPLLSLASGVDAVTRALNGRNDTARPGETSAWLQEINFYAEKDRGQSYGFESEGFGIAGGIERGTSMGAFGISTAFTSSDLEDDSSRAEEVLSANLVELGLYYRAQGQNWNVWGRAAAGYAFFDASRSFVGGGVFRTNEAEWNGFSLAAAAGANYERHFGRYSIRPEAIVEYFSLSEDGRTEEGGGDGFDLTIDDRDGHLFAATAAVNLGVGFGENYWFRPELRVGWKQNISFDPGETVARFTSGGAPFVLMGDTIEGGGPILGFRMNLGNELGMLSIEGDAEMIDDYIRYALLLRASFRF